jgi:hypothetical protein
VQDLHVLLRRPPGLLLAQQVVGQPEAAGGEEVLAVAIVGERPRLAHQPVDHVPVRDAVLAPAAQARQRLDVLLRVPHLQPLGVQAHLDPLADQPAGHGVGVAAHMDRAARVHAHSHALARLQPPRRQRPQQRHLLCQTPLPPPVALREQAPQELLIGGAAAEVPAAAQQQRLLQRPLELAVALLDVAVLVRPRRVDGLALQAVVPQQRLVAGRERRRALGPRRDGCGQPIGAMQLWHAAQRGQGVLQALAEALETLGEADRARLPVGVGQHEVVDQVRQRLAPDGDAQVGGVREVAGAQPARMMDLAEEHLPGTAVQGPPALDVPLQGAQLAVGEAPGEAALQVVEQGLGLQAGVQTQLLFELRPDLGEGVGPRAIVALHASHLAGEPPEAAVLARGLGVEPGLVGGASLGQSLEIESAEPLHLLIGDHPEPPVGAGSG